MSLTLTDLNKSYGPITAVADVSLELLPGRTLAVLGPSGCGKSTLLRLVAGLESPDSGRIVMGDRDVTNTPTQRRSVGMVFQDYALFPHLNVAGNVGFALVEQGRDRQQIRTRVAELLEMVGLAGYEARRTFELSGGQQQRVALARALAARPDLLLLDEPLSNLDPELRESLQRELQEILSNIEVQALYVTHAQEEAFTIAGETAVMRAGRIVQRGPSRTVLERPRNEWVARFLGYRNVVRIQGTNLPDTGSAALLIRDDLIEIGRGELPVRVRTIDRFGQMFHLSLQVPEWGIDLIWEGFRRELPEVPAPGDELTVRIPDAAWVPLETDEPPAVAQRPGVAQ